MYNRVVELLAVLLVVCLLTYSSGLGNVAKCVIVAMYVNASALEYNSILTRSR